MKQQPNPPHWLVRKRLKVFQAWKENRISYADALRDLHQLGVGVETAARWLSKT